MHIQTKCDQPSLISGTRYLPTLSEYFNTFIGEIIGSSIHSPAILARSSQFFIIQQSKAFAGIIASEQG